MVRIAVCDDDEGFRHSLIDTIRGQLPTVFSIAQFADGAALLRGLEQRQSLIDLILLDIRMPRLDGLETARRIRELDKGTVIILVSGYQEYAIDGYSVGAYYFLTKPLDKSRLLPVLTKAMKEVEETRKGFLAVNTQSECLYIPLDDILYIESNGRKKVVHTKEETHEFYEKMAVLHHRLHSKGFCRIHRCYLVNLDAVRCVNTLRFWVTLKDGSRLDVSRRQLNTLLMEMAGDM